MKQRTAIGINTKPAHLHRWIATAVQPITEYFVGLLRTLKVKRIDITPNVANTQFNIPKYINNATAIMQPRMIRTCGIANNNSMSIPNSFAKFMGGQSENVRCG